MYVYKVWYGSRGEIFLRTSLDVLMPKNNHQCLEEASNAIIWASELVERDNKDYSVVYVPNFNTMIVMPSEPDPTTFGWKVLTTLTTTRSCM
tara:strand:- start:24078 stop:24353 length:276 start_codon:yes stop_codon:yes gene_type:complete